MSVECPNGHTVNSGFPFCPKCGQPTSPAAAPADLTADSHSEIEQQGSGRAQPVIAAAGSAQVGAPAMLRRRMPLLLLGLAAVILTIIVVVKIHSGSQAAAGHQGGPTTRVQAHLPPPQWRCVQLWNTLGNQSARSLVLQLTGGQEDRYVSVGFSATYNDLCLITVSVPGVGAVQFMESHVSESQRSFPGPYQPVGDIGSANGLPPSVTHWNAHTDSRGMLSLNDYALSQHPTAPKSGSIHPPPSVVPVAPPASTSLQPPVTAPTAPTTRNAPSPPSECMADTTRLDLREVAAFHTWAELQTWMQNRPCAGTSGPAFEVLWSNHGPYTIDALTNAEATATALGPSMMSSGWSGTTLSTDVRQQYRTDVVQVQYLLDKDGYGPLAIDGHYGPLTMSVVTQYQVDHGIEPVGSVGPTTYASLYGD